MEVPLSLRYVLLGFLAENSNHGYGLRKQFMHRLGHFRKINEGQLYTELAKMEKEELIEREVEVPRKGPARKLVHITDKGRTCFNDWLLSDQYEDDGVLYDFMQGYPFFTKCSFFSHLDLAETARKLDAQLEILGRKKDVYREILARMKEKKVDDFRVRILAFGLEEIDHRIRWLKGLEKEISKGEGESAGA